MWTPTFHRFDTKAAFLAACDAAGWPRDHLGQPEPPASVSLDIIGPYAPAPTVVDGVLIPAEIDGRWHVNALWPIDDALPALWEAARITPTSPSRTFALPPPAAPQPPPVPTSVPAWKGKAALREAGLLAAVEAAVTSAGGRVLDAWNGAAVWERNGQFLGDLAGVIGLDGAAIDHLFQTADAIRG